MDLGNFILPFLYKGDGCGAPPRRMPLREISAQKSGICGADKNFYADDGLVHAVIVEYYVFSVNIRYQRAVRFFIIKLTKVFYVIMNGPPVGQKPLFIITCAPRRGSAGNPRRAGTVRAQTLQAHGKRPVAGFVSEGRGFQDYAKERGISGRRGLRWSRKSIC